LNRMKNLYVIAVIVGTAMPWQKAKTTMLMTMYVHDATGRVARSVKNENPIRRCMAQHFFQPKQMGCEARPFNARSVQVRFVA